MLKAGLRDGTINPNSLPSEVYQSQNEFKKYKLSTFQNQYYKLKTELGVHVRKNGTYVDYCRLRKKIKLTFFFFQNMTQTTRT